MNRLYVYHGTVASISYRPAGCGSAELVLWNSGNLDIAPTQIIATGGVAKYLSELSGTDAAERYLDVDWFYDSNLFLDHIEVPCYNSPALAKVICNAKRLSPDVKVFGPREYIETDRPEPMSVKQLNAWAIFRLKESSPYHNRLYQLNKDSESNIEELADDELEP